MRIAYLECFSGISGDMFLGALVDAGVPPRTLEDTVAALGIGARLEISHVMRSGISATKVNVWIDGKKDLPREEHAREEHGGEQHEHPHHHDHAHEDQHSERLHHDEVSPADHALPHEHSPSHDHGRGLTEIRQIISAAPISMAAKKTAIAIFEALGQAEAKIHN